MEIHKPEKQSVYLDPVREIIESDIFFKWALGQMEGINDEKNTLQHSQRIANLGYLLAKHLKFPKRKVYDFVEACLVHDIGKIKMPASILVKPGKEFTDEDRKIISGHAREGKEILKTQGRSPRVYNMALLHHEFQEKYYPEIGIEAADFEDEDVDNARLLAMIDVFDRYAFGAANIKPLPQDEWKPSLLKQFSEKGDEETIDFLISQYEMIKGLKAGVVQQNKE